MITRVVRLTFKPEHTQTFIEIMQQHHMLIRSFKGCYDLNSYQDTKKSNVFFTISTWQDETALNDYRHSDFFKVLWGKLKPMFADKALAHSMSVM
ncbi:MAG: antibiotic biosynthesis monooxygenase family protein [Bacteroidota bacterium]